MLAASAKCASAAFLIDIYAVYAYVWLASIAALRVLLVACDMMFRQNNADVGMLHFASAEVWTHLWYH